MLALGFVGAMAIGTPATTKAQGVSIYGPGYEVDIGNRPYPYRYRHRDYRYYNEPYASYYYPPNRYRYRTWNGCPNG